LFLIFGAAQRKSPCFANTMSLDQKQSEARGSSIRKTRTLDLVHDRLRDSTQPYRTMIEESLEKMFATGATLDQAIRHILFADAKRVRSSLALIAMEAAGGDAAAALPIAVAFELLHTASLIHDDIMDSACVRRRRPCVHRVFGVPLAITAGDALIFAAYRQMLLLYSHHPPAIVARVLKIFTECAARTCRGQAEDVAFAECATMRQYLEMIRAKTGSMIEAPLESAAVLAGAPSLWRNRLREYGRCVGIAFQIVDDSIDYLGSEDHARKTLGNDLRRGGATAMLIYCRDRSDAGQRDALTAAVGRARESRDPQSIDLLLGLFHERGAVEFTQRLCARYSDSALQALRGIGTEPARTELAAIARIVADWGCFGTPSGPWESLA
jgi:geranylgeranyl pyrophosphate synthase